METRRKNILEASIKVLTHLKTEIERKEKLKKIKKLLPQIPKPYVIFNTEPSDAEANILKNLYWSDDEDDLLKLNLWHVTDFEKLFEMVSEHSANVVTNWRQLTPRHKLAITIRYLATGEPFTSMESYCKVSRSAMSQFVPKILPQIYEALEKYYKLPTTKREWQQIATDFENLWKFPHVLGALVGKRIRLKSANHKPSNLVIFAAIDAHCRFINFDISSSKGSRANDDDSEFFLNGKLYTKLHNEQLSLPDDATLFEGGKELYPYYFISDEAFALETKIMRPYDDDDDHDGDEYGDGDEDTTTRNELNELENIFNFRIRYACMAVEYAMRKFVKRFGIFKRSLEMYSETSESVLKTACALHNYLTKKRLKPGYCTDTFEEEDLPETFTNAEMQFENFTNIGGTHIRNKLAHYFTAEGNVDFQWEQVEYTFDILT